MLRVRVPPGVGPERAYGVDVVLGEFLGLSHPLEVEHRSDTELTLERNATRVRMPDVLMASASRCMADPDDGPVRAGDPVAATYRGDFVRLWDDNNLVARHERAPYARVVDALSAPSA